MRGLSAVLAQWRRLMRDDFERGAAFLQSNSKLVGWYPCDKCACSHQVFRYDDGTICAACRCTPQHCYDIDLTIEDITAWELNRDKLSRAICKAFGLQRKTATWDLPETW